MEFENGSFEPSEDSADQQGPRATGGKRVLLREPERCLRCNQEFMSLYPLSDCAEHDGLDRV